MYSFVKLIFKRTSLLSTLGQYSLGKSPLENTTSAGKKKSVKCYAFVRGHELVNIIAYVKELSLFENTYPVSSLYK